MRIETVRTQILFARELLPCVGGNCDLRRTRFKAKFKYLTVPIKTEYN